MTKWMNRKLLCRIWDTFSLIRLEKARDSKQIRTNLRKYGPLTTRISIITIYLHDAFFKLEQIHCLITGQIKKYKLQ